MVYLYCKCCQHMAGNTNAATNFYDANFIPNTWKSHYSRLSECAGIVLAGRCKACYGDLEELIPIPNGLSGDDLFQAIYDTMQTAHPYAQTSEHIDYYGICDERNEFYRRRDKSSQFQRSKKFLELFHDYDREQARLWLEKHSLRRNTRRFCGILAEVCSAV